MYSGADRVSRTQCSVVFCTTCVQMLSKSDAYDAAMHRIFVLKAVSNLQHFLIRSRLADVFNLMNYFIRITAVLGLLMTYGCTYQSEPVMQPVSHVDIERFMGKWYVVANIPTFVERGALNPIEEYALNTDGTIKTTFTFEKIEGGERNRLEAKGFVQEGTGNAVWGMQFVWPFKADYRIVYLDPNYETTIIGRNKRDYLWIMSRSNSIPEDELQRLIQVAVQLGYERSDIQIYFWKKAIRRAS